MKRFVGTGDGRLRTGLLRKVLKIDVGEEVVLVLAAKGRKHKS